METPSDLDVTLVVPAFNEASRLDRPGLLSLLTCAARVQLIFVDDGSKDETPARLREIAAAHPDHIEVLTLPRNQGKAEAVRHGLNHALAGTSAIVGYVDADLATPPEEVGRLCLAMHVHNADVVMGSRVALLGSDIQRSHVRHYLGRVFASAASLILHAQVYDTQCGAKLFRRSATLEAALAEPFLSRWGFDIELLGRLLIGTTTAPAIDAAKFVEVPLHRWRDVAGSKLGAAAMARVLRDLVMIGADLSKRRRAVPRA